MRWLVLVLGLLAAGLLLFNTVSAVRRRAAVFGHSRWSWLVILSRVLLILPFPALALTGSRWPPFPALTAWFAGCALLILAADVGERLALLRAFKARQGKGPAAP